MRADSKADAVLLWGADVAGVCTTMMNDGAEKEEISPLNDSLTSKKPGKEKTNLAFEVQMFSQTFCRDQFVCHSSASDASALLFSCLLKYAGLD